jgi:tripartite-type tricarboxylate transporter receptor subunit TctC
MNARGDSHETAAFRGAVVPWWRSSTSFARMLVALPLVALIPAVVLAADASQTYPTRAIRIVVPYAPGGGTDILARRLGAELGKRFGLPIIIDNRQGGATAIGTEVVARAAPDGYTILVTGSTHPVLPALYPKLPFDPVRDFEPITLFANSPAVLLVNPTLPVKNLKEFLAYAKARHDPLDYGSSGYGGTGHLGMELLKQMAGINLVHIPYTSGAPAMTALLAGQVSVMINNITASVPQIKAGRVRALGVTTKTRTPALPDIPTVAEAGDLPDFEVSAWFGALAPAKTPRFIVDRLNKELNEIVATPEIRKVFAEQGDEAVGDTPEQFGQIIRSDVERWRRVLKAANIRAE